MTKILVFNGKKGGVGKTTSSVATAYLSSTIHKKKILCLDLDSQANFSSLLTGVEDSDEFGDRTIMEAMQELDASGEEIFQKYVLQVNENLHVIPVGDSISMFARWIYLDVLQNRPEINVNLILKRMLEKLLAYHSYDLVILDTAPSLSEVTINALSCATDVISMSEPSKFSLRSIEKFLVTIASVQENLNPDLRHLGILSTIIDARRGDNTYIIDHLRKTYGDLMFKHVIHRKATTARISLFGIEGNSEVNRAFQEYKLFVKELLDRL